DAGTKVDYGGDTQAESGLGGPASEDKFKTGEVVEDPLKIGGTFYLRYLGNAVEREQFKNVAFSSPNLLDIYLDARPNDRVRGFARFRMQYDPTYNPAATNNSSQLASVLSLSLANPGTSETSGTNTASTTVVTPPPHANPLFALDQLWLNFDILHTVFVTAGKQHVRWTVSRFWQPEDFLSPQQRDPLAVFDQRTGASLIKLHLPLEKLGWNFYALTLLDNIGPSNVFGKLGEAFRGEFVFGNTEIGLSSVFQGGTVPRYGMDISSALGPVDVYAEAALRPRADRGVVQFKPGAESKPFEFTLVKLINNGFSGTAQSFAEVIPYETVKPNHPVVQATGGFTWQIPYRDNDTLILGGEYFFNQLGYDDANLFAGALFTNSYVPFYAARHYAGAYVALVGPWSLDKGTISLSTLGNLSDRTFISRVDFLYQALTYLQLEAFADGHFGGNGEFQFGVDLPPQRQLPNDTTLDLLNLQASQRQQIVDLRDKGLFIGASTFDFGIGARISL
ncbi:MAG: hypothetical protein ACJ790_13365, partial [Myxococcaceae bacterium]